MERFASKAELEGERSSKVVLSKVALEIMDIPQTEDGANFGFAASAAQGQDLDESSLQSFSIETPSELLGSTIVIPEEAIAKASQKRK